MAFDYRKALESGASEDQILEYLNKTRGYDATGALNAGASKVQVIEYLANTNSQAQTQPVTVEEAPTGYTPSFAADPTDNRLKAGAKAIGNLPKSFGNFVGGIAKAVANPMETGKALGNLAVGGVEKLIPGNQPEEESFNAFANMLKERYGSLEALQKTATEDPFGFGADVLGVVGGVAGAAGKAGQLNTAISTTGKVATRPVAAVASKTAELVNAGKPKLLSYTSDIPEGAFKTMLERREPVTQAIKEGADAKSALQNTQGAVRQLRKTLTQEWQDSTLAIADEFKGKRLGFSGKNADELNSLADEFGFEIPQNIQNASVVEWIDTLKSINELPKTMLTLSPKGAKIRKLKELVQGKVIQRFGGENGSVAQLYKNYAAKKEVFDAANDIVSAYKTGKPIAQTTAQNRLQNIFDENKPAYLEAILDLEKATGQDLLSKVTASKFKNLAPNTYNRASAAGGLGVPKGAVEKGINLLLFPLTSPKIAGLINRARIPTPLKSAVSDINNFRIPTALKNKEGQLKVGLSLEDVSGIPKSLQPLAQEARKYKSAEEFVRKQPVVYHGSPVPLKGFSNKKGGVFFTDSMEDASGFAGSLDNVYEGYLNFKKPLVIDAKGAKWDELNTKYGKSTQEVVSNAQKDGYDGVTFKNIVDNVGDTADFGGQSTIHYAFKPKDAFINESQLTDFYNKVMGKAKKP